MNGKNKLRFDEYLALRRLVRSRHQAADLIRRRQVKLNDKILDKPSFKIDAGQRQRVQLLSRAHVSRAGDKLAQAAPILQLEFRDKIVLDVGAHKGGFTDYAHSQRAKFIVAVDVGRQPLDPSLSDKPNILAFCQTDIRQFAWPDHLDKPDLILVDLSFISLRLILDDLSRFSSARTQILALFKPQFETQQNLRKGVIANQAQRRRILSDWEDWLKDRSYRVLGKADSPVWGLKGNRERFYLIKKTT